MLDGRARRHLERVLGPLGRGAHRLGLTPDVLTVVGVLVSAGTAWLVAVGELRWAVLGIALSGFLDLLDGSVARSAGASGPRGAFLDSVADRVSDALVLGGVGWYLAGTSPYLPVLALAAAAVSMLVSYERARAEGLGVEARGGLMERAERMLLLGVALFFDLLVPALWLLVGLGLLTATQRFVVVWRQVPAASRRRPVPPVRHRRVGPVPPEVGRQRLARWWERRRPVMGRGRGTSAPSRRRDRP